MAGRPAPHVIAQAFKDYASFANYLTSESSYRSAVSKLEPLEFSIDDVLKFAGSLNGKFIAEGGNYWTVGLFISAAINKVIKSGETVALDLSGLENIDGIGYRMSRGTMILQGNAGDYLGESMTGGNLTVSGDAGNYVGYAMSGGLISVEGNAALHLGTYMSGGVIRIGGRIGSTAKSCKGTVYCGNSGKSI